MKKFTITRSKWARGNINKPSEMLNRTGHMCCLGQIASQCGVPDYQLLHTADPTDLAGTRSEHEELFVELGLVHPTRNNRATDFCIKAVHDNDDKDITEETREVRLTELFSQNGIELEFKD